jgi:hypothetical protein
MELTGLTAFWDDWRNDLGIERILRNVKGIV